MSADVAEYVGYNEDSASPLTVSKPASFATGQLLVFVITQDGGALTSLTAPTGWTALSAVVDISSQRVKAFYHVFDSGDPASWNFPYDGGSSIAGALFRITGADTTPTIVAATNSSNSNTATMDSPSVTPTGTDDVLLCTYSNQGGAHTLVYTVPSGMTNLGSSQVAGGFNCMAAAKVQLASGSATGVKTWSGLSPTGGAAGTFSIAVKSASGATPLSLDDVPYGSATGFANETVTSGIVKTDTSYGSLAGFANETPAAVVFDTAFGSLTGFATETVTNDILLTDKAYGSLTGYTTEAITKGLTLTDTTAGSLTGFGSETVSNDTSFTDTAYGSLTGFATEFVTQGQSVNDTAYGSASGFATETITQDLLISDVPFGSLVGFATEDISSGASTSDIPYGSLSGFGIETPIFDLLLSDTAYGTLSGYTTESFTTAQTFADIPYGSTTGYVTETITFDTIIADSSYGSLVGFGTEQIAQGVFFDDTPFGTLTGYASESVTNPPAVNTTDTPYGTTCGIGMETWFGTYEIPPDVWAYMNSKTLTTQMMAHNWVAEMNEEKVTMK